VRAWCSDGTAVVTLTRPAGTTIRDDESLVVVVNNFVATGGDGILGPVAPEGGFPIDYAAPLVRDVFAEYLARIKGPIREEPLLERGRQHLVSNCGGGG
jgi:hypothetical protein